MLLGDQPRRARSVVNELIEAGAAPRDVYLQVLAPALQQIGTRWECGQVSVAQEHLATAVVASLMATLATTMLVDVPRATGRVLLACTDSEMHTIGLRMVADFLEADGWEVLYLGAATPVEAIASMARDTQPDVVGLSTALQSHLPQVQAAIASMQQLPVTPWIFVGGQAYDGVPERAYEVGADAFAADAGAASTLLSQRFAHG